jgi:hypothetical protein
MAEFRNPGVIASAPADGDLLQYSAATDTWVPVTLGSLPAATIPQAHPTEPTQTAADAPAGGTGAAAGAWDTSAHRDAAIATINDTVTDVAALITWADNLQTKLTTAGILD